MKMSNEKTSYREFNKRTIRGQIQGGKWAPKRYESTDGKISYRFSLRYTTASWKNKEGVTEYRNAYCTVFLPQNNYGAKVFDRLQPTRQVEVTGQMRMHSSPRRDNNGVYLEEQICSATVEFLDQPIERQMKNIFEILEAKGVIKDGKLMGTVEDAESKVLNYIKELYITPVKSEGEDKEEDLEATQAGF